jgi:hypothetical protein
MTTTLGDLLDKSKYAEPPQIKVIKDYIQLQFKADAAITVGPKQIVINVQSAALAGALRMHLHQLQKLCETDKKLIIRIS